MIDWEDLDGIDIDGVDRRDYPDFCDAYVAYAINIHTGEELSSEQYDHINSEYGAEINRYIHDHQLYH